jgi:ADP-ribosyl-[dinitrogen reductase] hydrolase
MANASVWLHPPILLFESVFSIKNDTLSMMQFHYQNILLGVAIGDALGVPVEFTSRQSLEAHPVTHLRGYGTHNMPAGTFSDDGSLTFCLAEALTAPFSLQSVANNMLRWYEDGFWTAHGEVFDIGIATKQAIEQLQKGIAPTHSGNTSEQSNGNGSLMRILPLVMHLHHLPIEARWKLTKCVSGITHAHIRSVIACFYYLEFARLLLQGNNQWQAYAQLQTDLPQQLLQLTQEPKEVDLFSRLLHHNIATLNKVEISSSGYVLHTLEASIWCLLTTHNFTDAVLKAVNLGLDTDTTGTVTGGLAAMLYGYQSIPEQWLQQLAKRTQLLQLAARWQAYQTNNGELFV